MGVGRAPQRPPREVGLAHQPSHSAPLAGWVTWGIYFLNVFFSACFAAEGVFASRSGYLIVPKPL